MSGDFVLWGQSVKPDMNSFLARKIERQVRLKNISKLPKVLESQPQILLVHKEIEPEEKIPEPPKIDTRLPRLIAASERALAHTERLLRLKLHMLHLRLRGIRGPVITGSVIIRSIAEKHGISPEQIKGVARTHKVCLIRHEAAYEIAEKTQLSLAQIGKAIGGREHTSVAYMINQHCLRHGLDVPRGMLFRARKARKPIVYSGVSQFEAVILRSG